METFSGLLALCAENSSVIGDFPPPPPPPTSHTHKGQWRGGLMFSSISAWTNGWVNNRDAGDLRRHRAHYDVIVMHQRLDTVKTYYRTVNIFKDPGKLWYSFGEINHPFTPPPPPPSAITLLYPTMRHHDMENLSTLLVLCDRWIALIRALRSFDIFFVLSLICTWSETS